MVSYCVPRCYIDWGISVVRWPMQKMRSNVSQHRATWVQNTQILDRILKKKKKKICVQVHLSAYEYLRVIGALKHGNKTWTKRLKQTSIFHSNSQAYLYRALTFAALGLTDDAIISYCLSIHFNRSSTPHSKSNRLEIAKVFSPFNSCKTHANQHFANHSFIRTFSVDSKVFDELQFDHEIIVDARIYQSMPSTHIEAFSTIVQR